PEAEEKFNATYASIDDVMKKADFVVLMTPLTPETTGLITKREFSLMKDSAIFINMSRGQTIIEKDLIEVLKAGKIRGDRKSTRLKSSHVSITYAVFCLKKKKMLNSTNLYTHCL